MDTLKNLLNLGWIGSLISLMSLISAVVFYRASRIGARPVYQGRALRPISEDARMFPEDIEMLFKGASVSRLTIAHIVYWNSGRTTIRANDIVAEDPIRCIIDEGAQVLRARVLKQKRPSIRFEAVPNAAMPNEVPLSFDYLDPGDGAVVELLHTGEHRLPRIVGTIRGIPRGILNWGHLRSSGGRSGPMLLLGEGLPFPALVFRGRILYSVLFVAAVLVLGAVFTPASFFQSEFVGHSIFLSRGIAVGIGIIYALPSGALLWSGRRRFPKALQVE